MRTVKRQLPAVEEEPRPLLTGPERVHKVVEARPEVEAKPDGEAKDIANAETLAADWVEDVTDWRAEVEDARRRSERQAEVYFREERQRLLTRLLTVADNLERALAHADQDDALRAGVQLTLDDLRAQLAQEGVEPIQALNQSFDPNVHDAVATDGSSGDTVVEVLQTGYTLKGELLRAARVIVGSLVA